MNTNQIKINFFFTGSPVGGSQAYPTKFRHFATEGDKPVDSSNIIVDLLEVNDTASVRYLYKRYDILTAKNGRPGAKLGIWVETGEMTIRKEKIRVLFGFLDDLFEKGLIGAAKIIGKDDDIDKFYYTIKNFHEVSTILDKIIQAAISSFSDVLPKDCFENRSSSDPSNRSIYTYQLGETKPPVVASDQPPTAMDNLRLEAGQPKAPEAVQNNDDLKLMIGKIWSNVKILQYLVMLNFGLLIGIGAIFLLTRTNTITKAAENGTTTNRPTSKPENTPPTNNEAPKTDQVVIASDFLTKNENQIFLIKNPYNIDKQNNVYVKNKGEVFRYLSEDLINFLIKDGFPELSNVTPADLVKYMEQNPTDIKNLDKALKAANSNLDYFKAIDEITKNKQFLIYIKK